jgi:hypothetical protein
LAAAILFVSAGGQEKSASIPASTSGGTGINSVCWLIMTRLNRQRKPAI